MNYVFEVHYTATGSHMRSPDGAERFESFELSEAIRDTNYRAISLSTFGNKDRALDFSAGKTTSADRVLCDLEIAIGDLDAPSRGQVFLVNPFEISQEQIPDVLEMWHAAKHHMIAHKGFVNARLFRSRSSQDRYGLLNVAQWSSSDAFKQALGDKAYDSHRERSLNYKLHPSLCIRLDQDEMA